MRFLKDRILDLRFVAVFLTRAPLAPLNEEPPPLARCLWAAPAIGAAVGGVAAGVYALVMLCGLSRALAALAATAALSVATGGLHEDGLADVFDGFGGGATRARKLEIMRDSRIGSYGVLAIVLLVALRWTALTRKVDVATVFSALVVAGAMSRMALPLTMVIGAPARKDGLGALAGRPGPPVLPSAVGLASAIALAVAPRCVLPALGLTCAVCLGVAFIAHRQIGGYTGDVLGAAASLSEGVVLVLITEMARQAS